MCTGPRPRDPRLVQGANAAVGISRLVCAGILGVLVAVGVSSCGGDEGTALATRTAPTRTAPTVEPPTVTTPTRSTPTLSARTETEAETPDTTTAASAP